MIEAIEDKVHWLTSVKGAQKEEKRKQVDESLTALKAAKQALELTKESRCDIERLYITGLALYEAKYALISEQHAEFRKSTFYGSGPEHHQEMEKLERDYLSVFGAQFAELNALAEDKAFRAMLVLSQHTQDAKILKKAIGEMWAHQTEGRDTEQLALNLQEIAEGKIIYENKMFSLLGHAFTAIATGKTLTPLTGSDLNNIFLENLRQQSTLESIACCLVSLFLWTNSAILHFEKTIDSNYLTYNLLPAAFDKKPASTSFSEDLHLHFSSIQAQLHQLQEIVQRDCLLWPPVFSAPVEAMLACIKRQATEIGSQIRK